MRNNLTILALAAGLACTGTVSAESASEQLTRIEAETMLLKAREKQLDVQASIIAKQNDIASKQHAGDQLAQSAGAGDPTIRSIEGIGKKMFATLQLNTGNTVDAQVGDVLSNGMKVVSIKSNEVILAKGKKHIRLAVVQPPAPVVAAGYPVAAGGFGQMAPLPAVSPMAPRGAAK